VRAEQYDMSNAATFRQCQRFTEGDLVLSRYRVTGELGQGGMGVVYGCRDEVGGIDVALKALPPDLSRNSVEMEEVRENFQLVSRLSHPNIAQIRTLEKDPATGDYYLVMECVEEVNLRRYRKQHGGTLTLDEVLPIARQIAEALDYAHSERIIHRDIKPSNVMVREDGVVKVLDFGLAAQIQTSLSRVSRVNYGTSGTGPYMAPEQWRGQYQDAATDQYALAVLVYELLAGRCPFENPDISILREAVLKDEPEPVPATSEHVWQVLARALLKGRKLRFGDCRQFAAALAGVGGEGVSVAGSDAPSDRSVKRADMDAARKSRTQSRLNTFVFESGEEARGRDELFRLCRAYPEETIRKLYSQDIEKWLTYYGDDELAMRAKRVRETCADREGGLEEFLTGTRPFIFRTGTMVWSAEEAFAFMSEHPAEAVVALYESGLPAWLAHREYSAESERARYACQNAPDRGSGVAALLTDNAYAALRRAVAEKQFAAQQASRRRDVWMAVRLGIGFVVFLAVWGLVWAIGSGVEEGWRRENPAEFWLSLPIYLVPWISLRQCKRWTALAVIHALIILCVTGVMGQGFWKDFASGESGFPFTTVFIAIFYGMGFAVVWSSQKEP
jgi:serine/threonine protein kinase